jgi:thiosulfate dehydrogenase
MPFFNSSAEESRSNQTEPPEIRQLPLDKMGLGIRYGYRLLSETPIFIGPGGSVGTFTQNRMSCGNCHLDVGRRPNGNSWLDAHSLYPQYREREGKIQTLADRINTCSQHNLGGRPLPVEGQEMRAMLLYFKWLGRGRPALESDPDERIPKLGFLPIPADAVKGAVVYEKNCVTCHGRDGRGKMMSNGSEFQFPPLWGPQSFSTGTSMSRLSIVARFIKGNMPYEPKPGGPSKLTDEEAWNVAAYILNQKRPAWGGKSAFPSISGKPFDYPIGPYDDNFPAEQHRIGPFQPIVDFWTKRQGQKAARATTGV